MKKAYVLIYQKPLEIKLYSSLTALYLDNPLEKLGVCQSTLEKWRFKVFNDFKTDKIIISYRNVSSAIDIRNKLSALEL